ncbi:MAG: hypothetical protein ACTHOD_05065 [Motilibacteraceae bacterium]
MTPEQRLGLLARIDELRWSARWDGRPAAAQWLADRYDGAPVDEERVRARSLDLLDLHSARLVPLLAVAPRTGAWWAVWPRTPGVALPRLRALCELSPRQAAAVGLSVLHAVQDLHARGWWHGRLGTTGPDGSGDVAAPDGSDVVVAPDGTARLGGWAAGTLLLDGPADALRRDDLLAVRALAADLLARTRTGARWSTEQREAEVAAVAQAGDPRVDGPVDERSGPDAPHPVAHALERRLAALLGGPDLAERTRLELAALVRAVPQAVDVEPDPVGEPPDAPVPGARRRSLRYPRRPATSHLPSRPRRTSGEPRTDRGSWLWKAIVALTVLAVVVGLELGLLGDRIANDLRVLRSPAPSATASAGTNAKVVAALPSLGPSTAGVVATVDARALGACAPGTACTLRVVVQVQRQQRAVPVRWAVLAVDRCTARRTTLPGGSLTVPAGSTTASALRTVTLPKGKALAVGAVTTAPARAASKPLPAPARPPTC